VLAEILNPAIVAFGTEVKPVTTVKLTIQVAVAVLVQASGVVHKEPSSLAR
jgi:hypothetical protein